MDDTKFFADGALGCALGIIVAGCSTPPPGQPTATAHVQFSDHSGSTAQVETSVGRAYRALIGRLPAGWNMRVRHDDLEVQRLMPIQVYNRVAMKFGEGDAEWPEYVKGRLRMVSARIVVQLRPPLDPGELATARQRNTLATQRAMNDPANVKPFLDDIFFINHAEYGWGPLPDINGPGCSASIFRDQGTPTRWVYDADARKECADILKIVTDTVQSVADGAH